MNIILAILWRKILHKTIEALAITTATVVATKGVEHLYDKHLKLDTEEETPKPARKRAKKKNKK